MEQVERITGSPTSLAPLERDVRLKAFEAIYGGDTPLVRELSSLLNASAKEVEEAVRRLLERGLLTMAEDGRINGSHGLTLSPTEHRVTFDVGIRFVWCAVDAVGIPAALGGDVRIASRCLQCGTAVSLTIKEGQPVGPDVGSLRIGMGVLRSAGKVVEEVCPTINFFCSAEHADAWAETTTGAQIIDLRRAAEIGRREWADIAHLGG